MIKKRFKSAKKLTSFVLFLSIFGSAVSPSLVQAGFFSNLKEKIKNNKGKLAKISAVTVPVIAAVTCAAVMLGSKGKVKVKPSFFAKLLGIFKKKKPEVINPSIAKKIAAGSLAGAKIMGTGALSIAGACGLLYVVWKGFLQKFLTNTIEAKKNKLVDDNVDIVAGGVKKAKKAVEKFLGKEKKNEDGDQGILDDVKEVVVEVRDAATDKFDKVKQDVLEEKKEIGKKIENALSLDPVDDQNVVEEVNSQDDSFLNQCAEVVKQKVKNVANDQIVLPVAEVVGQVKRKVKKVDEKVNDGLFKLGEVLDNIAHTPEVLARKGYEGQKDLDEKELLRECRKNADNKKEIMRKIIKKRTRHEKVQKAKTEISKRQKEEFDLRVKEAIVRNEKNKVRSEIAKRRQEEMDRRAQQEELAREIGKSCWLKNSSNPEYIQNIQKPPMHKDLLQLPSYKKQEVDANEFLVQPNRIESADDIKFYDPNSEEAQRACAMKDRKEIDSILNFEGIQRRLEKKEMEDEAAEAKDLIKNIKVTLPDDLEERLQKRAEEEQEDNDFWNEFMDGAEDRKQEALRQKELEKEKRNNSSAWLKPWTWNWRRRNEGGACEEMKAVIDASRNLGNKLKTE